MNWNDISASKKELFGRSVTYNGFIPKCCTILCSAVTKLSIKSSSVIIEFKNSLSNCDLFIPCSQVDCKSTYLGAQFGFNQTRTSRTIFKQYCGLKAHGEIASKSSLVFAILLTLGFAYMYWPKTCSIIYLNTKNKNLSFLVRKIWFNVLSSSVNSSLKIDVIQRI